MNMNRALTQSYRLARTLIAASPRNFLVRPISTACTNQCYIKFKQPYKYPDHLTEEEIVRLKKHHKICAEFQKPNGVPVHLKAGFWDFVFLRVLQICMFWFGVAMLIELYPMAFPKKEKRT